ncbi:MAG: DUF5067 domain-containing protein [Ruminococcus sp.]|nr:DUF5067 domain-containing protein [Ruminococcus sp.]
MYCNRCGKPIPNGSIFCNSCGAPQGQRYQPNQPQRVQYNQTQQKYANPKKKNEVSPIVAIGIIFFSCCFGLIAILGGNHNNHSRDETNITESVAEPALTTQETTQNPPEAEPTVIIAGYQKSLNENNTPILTIYFDFTNTTNQELSFADCFADSVTQSDHSLYCEKYIDDEAFSKKLQPNETIKIGIVYVVNDENDTSPFEVKLTDLYGQKTYLTETLN